MPVEIRLLGPVEVWVDGRAVAVGVPQRRVVLSAFAVDVGRLVTRDTLIDRVWDVAPTRVDAAVYAHVSHLRRVLDEVNAVECRVPPLALDRQAGGYRLCADAEDVDLHRFRRLVRAAQVSACPAGGRIELLREALGLWRGPALAGLSGGWVSRIREGWAHERVEAVVAWAQAELVVGNPTAVLEPLGELAAEFPFAEPVAGVLMRALSAAGRPADALAHYAVIRRRLVEELGTDPSLELQEVHQAVLAGTVNPSRSATQGIAPLVVPAQLPADVAGFTGHRTDLAQLDHLLDSPGVPPDWCMPDDLRACATPGVDLARFLHDQLAQASPSLLRQTLTRLVEGLMGAGPMHAANPDTVMPSSDR